MNALNISTSDTDMAGGGGKHVQTLSIYIASLSVEYSRGEEEVREAGIMVGIRTLDSFESINGKEENSSGSNMEENPSAQLRSGGWVWQHWDVDWVFRKESDE